MFPNGVDLSLGEKEKLLVTSDFSLSHSVLKRVVLYTRRNNGLFGKVLNIFLSELYSDINLNIFVSQ